MRLAKNKRRSGPLLGLRVRRERPDTRTRRASIDNDRHERHQQGRGKVRRGEPEGGVPIRKEGQHPWARSPIRPRNTSSCETGYARSPHKPTPPDIARATRARASTILRSMKHLPV